MNKTGLIWGRDFCFTYGPLAYLPMRRAWDVSALNFILYDIFYLANVLLIFYTSVRNSANRLITIIIIAATVITLPTYIGGDSALVWLFILIFWLIKSLQEYKRIYILPVITITTLLFFLKFNTAFVTIILFFLTGIYLIFFGKDRMFIIASLLLLPVLIWLCANLLNVDLPGYIISGFEMVRGYNEIMYLDVPETRYLFPYMYAMMVAAVLVISVKLIFKKQVWTNRKELFKQGIITFMFCLALFILYKQCALRADIYHLIYFFVYFSFLMLCIPGVFDSAKTKSIYSAIVLVLIAIPLYTVGTADTLTIMSLEDKITKKYYFENMYNYSREGSIKLFPNGNALPTYILSRIGNSTIDSFPWNTYMLYENKLNYLPRPVMQSYTAYTKYLEDLNFDHYNSPAAPEYVLYSYQSNDSRYPLFDEPKVNLVLLNNYEVVEQFIHLGTPLLLLKKKEKAKPVELRFKREYAMYLGSELVPQKGIYYEITLYNTASGKLDGLFTHTPETEMFIVNHNNVLQTYRTSPALLKSGIFGTAIINNNRDFVALLESGGTEYANRLAYYKFAGKSDRFKQKIRIKEYSITH